VTYSTFIGVIELSWLTAAVVGLVFSTANLRDYRRDAAGLTEDSAIARETARELVLGVTLIRNEGLRVTGHLLNLLIALPVLFSSNSPTAPTTWFGPVVLVVLVIGSWLNAAQSISLWAVRQRLRRVM
jgi:hypothetical protein